MHVLVATAGVIPPDSVADLAEQLVGHYGQVTVMTVIEVPHAFLDTVRSEEWRPLDDGGSWPSEEQSMVRRYVEERGRRLVEPVLATLWARGIISRPLYMESPDPAEAILSAAEDLEADVIMLGATRAIFAESSWQSVSARVVQEARLPVLVIPPPQRVDEAVTNEA